MIILALILLAAVSALFFSMMRVGAATNSVSLWSEGSVPTTVNTGDSTGVELGVKFQSHLTGDVTGVKFYKSNLNLGTHIGNLWDSSGNNLASVTFTGETASGWQTATFAQPVHIAANTTYVISYFAPQGNFSMDSGYFATAPHTNGPLVALQDGSDGANGVYMHGGSSAYPSSPSSGDNYWVDLVFMPDAISAPVNATATQYQDSVRVQWAPGTNSSEVVQYQISRNGVQIGVVDGTVFDYVDTADLQPNTTYNYEIRAVDATATATGPSNTATAVFVEAHESVKAISSASTITDPEWFKQAYAEGFRLYVMHSTAWGTCTPWYNAQAQLGMALEAGLKIAVYTHDPNCWQGGLLATGPYRDYLQFFALYIESDPGVAATREMVDGVKAMGVRPIIHTGSEAWNNIQGATENDFSDVPLWDTSTSSFDYATWQANYLAPTPVSYGGWNTPTTMRVGVKQQREYSFNGVDVSLSSFDTSFLAVGELDDSLPVAPTPSLETAATIPLPEKIEHNTAVEMVVSRGGKYVSDVVEPMGVQTIESIPSEVLDKAIIDQARPQQGGFSLPVIATGVGVLLASGVVFAIVRRHR